MSYIEDYNKKKVEEAEIASRIYNDTLQALRSEDRFVNFFNQYHPQSVESFAKYYAQMKTHWYKMADSQMQYRKMKASQWRNSAVASLKEIFLKKLFNVKCLWLAGEMDIDGVEISDDFGKWFNNPAGCTFVTPITTEEFNCYVSFLDNEDDRKLISEEDDYDERNAMGALGFYHLLKSGCIDEFNDEKELPRWFRYYDKKFGTGDLLNLSTIRMDIEQDYHDIWSKEIFSKTLNEEQLKGWFHIDRRERMMLRNDPEKRKAFYAEQHHKYEERKKTMPQYFSISIYDREKIKELVALIEPPEIKKLYKANREWRDRRDSQEMIEMSLIRLKEAKEWIAVNSADDYRDAIGAVYDEYAERKHREALPVIFEEYCEAVAAGQPFSWSGNDGYSGYDSSTEMKKRLLEARKFKGEPVNFDFLKKESLSKNS